MVPKDVLSLNGFIDASIDVGKTSFEQDFNITSKVKRLVFLYSGIVHEQRSSANAAPVSCIVWNNADLERPAQSTGATSLS